MVLPNCSSPAELLASLRTAGFTLVPRGEMLEVRPAGRLTDDLRAAIRAHKAELLRLLTTETPAAEADPWPALLRAANRADKRLEFVLSVLKQFGAEAKRTAGGGWLVRAGKFENFCFWAERWLAPFRQECEAAGIAWEGDDG